MITPKTYHLPQSTYVDIVFRTRLRRYWWIYLAAIFLAIFNLADFGEDRMSTFLVIFGFAYPIYSAIMLYIWSTNRRNAHLFSERTVSFHEDYFHVQEIDGTEAKIPYANIIEVKQTSAYWMLYTSDHHFIYIPKELFTTEEVTELEGLIGVS